MRGWHYGLHSILVDIHMVTNNGPPQIRQLVWYPEINQIWQEDTTGEWWQYRMPMTPKRLKACLDTLQWTKRGLAHTLGRSEGTVRQWTRGTVKIPDDVEAWIEKMIEFREQNPPPNRSKKT